MSLVFKLGVSSVDAITLRPDNDLVRDEVEIKDSHRAQGGKLYQYKWSSYDRFEFTAQFVSNANAAIVNSWWSTGTELLFFISSDGVTEISSVMLTSTGRPFKKFQPRAPGYMKGAILLEGY